MKIIKLNKKDLDRANAFADKRCGCDTSLYESRGSFKRIDIVIGALAEIACHRFLKEYGITTTRPDFKIYEKSKKSYEADLRTDSQHFHVKGQSMRSVKRYGCSWLMQRRDPILVKPQKSHYIMPCVVDLDKKEAYLYGIPSILTLLSYKCFGECAVPSFRRTKVALYKSLIDSTLTYNALWSVLYRGGK